MTSLGFSKFCLTKAQDIDPLVKSNLDYYVVIPITGISTTTISEKEIPRNKVLGVNPKKLKQSYFKEQPLTLSKETKHLVVALDSKLSWKRNSIQENDGVYSLASCKECIR